MRRSRRPDPEVRRLLLQLSVLRWAGAAGPAALTTVRRHWQLAVKAFASREPVGAISECEIPGPDGPIRMRAYHPGGPAGPRPVLAWFHGGGFIFGDLYTAGATCRALTNRSGALVVAVQYRLAPEHPLEAGRTDCLAAVRWLAEHAAELGGDPGRLAVGGDSAGGGIAALVAQECARRGPPLTSQVLVYPATDMAGSYPSASEPMPGPLTPAWMAWIRKQIAEVSDLTAPESSAVRTPDLTGVAPAIVLTAGFDPLRDEGLHYAERLTAAGVPVRVLHYPGQIHGFVTFDRVLAGARDALRRLGEELSRSFADGPISGVEDDLPPGRHVDHMLWLNPRQRWHELKVAALMLKEQLGAAPRTDTARRGIR
jgi:acetyl esterase